PDDAAADRRPLGCHPRAGAAAGGAAHRAAQGIPPPRAARLRPAVGEGGSLNVKHPWLELRIAIPLGLVLLAVQLPFLHWALRGAAEVTAAVPYQDKFERASLGDAWWSNGGHWRIVKGELYSPGVGNNP